MVRRPDSTPVSLDAETLRGQLRELELVVETMRALTSSLELPDILRAVLECIRKLTSAAGLSLLLWDPEREELVFAATETLRENTLVGTPDDLGPTRAADDAGTLTVRLRHGARVLGAIHLRGRWGGGAFTAADRQRAVRIAGEIAADLRLDEICHDPGALRLLFDRIAGAVPSVAAELRLCDPRGHQLAFRASRALEQGVIDGVRIRLGQGIAGWVARHRQPVRLDDAAADPRHDPTMAQRTGLVPRSMLCVPVARQDTLLGVIQVINRLDGGTFTDHELALVEALAGHAAIALEHAMLYRQAHVAAITDDLTGLGNTRRLYEALPALLGHHAPVSMLVLDLDHLKALVDTHGHLVGSRTIAGVGRLIGARLRPGDVGVRFGGDEFVVLLPETPAADAAAFAERIRADVEGWATLDEPVVDVRAVTASIGVATFPEHASDGETLFRAADEAMYAVKRTRRNGVAVAPASGSPPPGR